MKPLNPFKIVFSLGCAYGICPIMPSLAGSVPVGASSGVTLPNSVGTPVISAPPTVTIPSVTPPSNPPTVTVPSVTPPSNPPTVTVPSVTPPSESVSAPVTPSSTPSNPVFVVNPATQATLNQTAIQTFTELRSTASTMSRIVSSPKSSNLTTPVRGITVTSGTLTQSNQELTPMQVGVTTAMQVESGNRVDIITDSVTVNIPPVSFMSDRTQVSTNVTITTANNQNLDLVLTGTSEQVSNAAAFVAMAASAEFSLDQIKTGTSIALTGTEFGQVGTLINSIAGLFDSIPQSGDSNLTDAITVSPQQLNTAILTFNQIVDDSNDETIVMLSRNSEFLTIGTVLKRLRGAIASSEMP